MIEWSEQHQMIREAVLSHKAGHSDKALIVLMTTAAEIVRAN